MLTIRMIRELRGPNLWAPVPVIELEVAIGELEARLQRETPLFFDRLVALLPSLETHRATVGRPELGFARLLLAPIAVALQQDAGIAVAYAETHPTAAPGLYRVVYAYHHEDVGTAAGQLAVRLLNHLLYGSEPAFNLAHEAEETIIRPTERHSLGPFLDPIVAAATRRGIPVVDLNANPPLLQLGTGAFQRRLGGAVPAPTAGHASHRVSDPELTQRLLRGAGLPTATRFLLVHDVARAVEAARRLGFPVVLEPYDAGRNRDPSLPLATEAAVRDAFPRIAQQARSRRVVVKRVAPETLYRLLVVGEKVVAVAEQGSAPGIGDEPPTAVPGSNDGDDPEAPPVLTAAERPREDLADAGPVVQPPTTDREIAVDRTPAIHPDTAAIARLAAQVVGLEVAGIDLLTPDITRSLLTEGGGIVAIDPAPDLCLHTQPTEGMPRDAGMAIVDHLFPPGRPVRVPIVAVTGTAGKTTTTRLIAHILTTAGKRVGMTSSDGIAVAGTQLVTGDQARAFAARKVLRHPVIDAAVLETPHGTILNRGLAFAHCDVAVVTNVAADHLGTFHLQTLEDLARVKAVVPRSVVPDGASVLNADNPYTVAMAEVVGGEILFFSLAADNPVVHDHIQRGGRAVVLRPMERGELLTLLAQGEATPILAVEEIPATMAGRIRVNIANALAATAAAVAQDVPVETIRAALRTFANSIDQSPGRFNVLELDGRTVVVDYCHNLHGLEALADFVKRMAAPHTVAAIYMLADRTDEHITAFGRLAAQIFDELVISGRKYKGGRAPGEACALLQAGAIAGGLAPDKITLADDQLEAADMAIAKSGKDSLVLVRADRDGTAVWKHLTLKYHAKPRG